VGTVLVTGGSGTFGSRLVPLLAGAGHDVRVLSRRAGAGTHVGDLSTGAGLAAACAGADVVVHAASDTRRFGRTDEAQTRRLLAACGGARHLLYVSIVGIEAIPYPYYRRKLACEGLVAGGGVPWSILRATQFHELLDLVLGFAARLPAAALPLDFQFQPVAAAEVAARVAGLVGAGPAGTADDFGGPEVRTLAELAGVWRAARGVRRPLVPLPLPGRVARGFRYGCNTCPDHAEGRQTWAEFLASGSPGPAGGTAAA
jgi:uncharacterized protein YbjT (DUF2867 family)